MSQCSGNNGQLCTRCFALIFNCAFIVHYQKKAQDLNNWFFLLNLILFVYDIINFSLIHVFWLHVIPNFVGKFSFQMASLLNMIIRKSFYPFAEHDNTTVKDVFSLLIIQIGTAAVPSFSFNSSCWRAVKLREMSSILNISLFIKLNCSIIFLGCYKKHSIFSC